RRGRRLARRRDRDRIERLLRRRREFVDVQVPAPFALGLEPRLVARGDEPARVSLRLRRPDREVVRVLVLRVAGVSADPAPVDLVPAGRRDELPPEIDVLDLAALPAPA